ncbi:MAG: glucose 1-dehydrogenase [Anaerolineales bacterium]|nr:glucose 1-dehydrogenase [Anaerolineales bacterium]
MKMLKDKRAIITGGGTGIGRGIALRLAAEGASVCISYNASRTGADETLRLIQANGGEAVALKANLERPDEGIRMIEVAIEHLGGVDILVNNAGLTITKPFVEVTQEDWDRIHNIDLKSSFFCTQTAVRAMKASAIEGKIIFISSVHSRASISQFAPYAASKGGMEALVRQLSIELSPDHINVNCVAPGLIEVESYYRDFPWYRREDSAKQIPIGRVGFPADIAAMVAFLASDEASFVTGQTIYVDGGQLAQLSFGRPDIN